MVQTRIFSFVNFLIFFQERLILSNDMLFHPRNDDDTRGTSFEILICIFLCRPDRFTGVYMEKSLFILLDNKIFVTVFKANISILIFRSNF